MKILLLIFLLTISYVDGQVSCMDFGPGTGQDCPEGQVEDLCCVSDGSSDMNCINDLTACSFTTTIYSSKKN